MKAERNRPMEPVIAYTWANERSKLKVDSLARWWKKNKMERMEKCKKKKINYRNEQK